MKHIKIEKALAKAPKGGGVIGIDLPDGMVLRLEYHTVGDINVCDDYREVTSEQWDWEKAGCKDNEEWHRYLNRQMWRDYSAGLNREEA